MAWGEGSKQPGVPQVQTGEARPWNSLDPGMEESQELGLCSSALSPVSLCPVSGRAISLTDTCH